jgi:hypothetical protein
MLDNPYRDKCPSCDSLELKADPYLILCANCDFTQYLNSNIQISYCMKIISKHHVIAWYKGNNRTIVWRREKYPTVGSAMDSVEFDFHLPFDITEERLKKIMLLK